MDAELEHLKACIADLRNGVIKDIRVECVDGSTEVSSVLVSARSGVLKRMVDGTFKEGVENHIRFPTSKIGTVVRVLDYVQYGAVAEFTSSRETLEDFEFAHMYGIDAYADIMHARLTTLAAEPTFAMGIYMGCGKDSRYTEIKSLAQKTIFSILGDTRYHICFCNKCKLYQAPKFKCATVGCPCKPMKARADVRCAVGRRYTIAPPDSCRDESCDGKIEITDAKTTVLSAPALIRIEIFDAYLRHMSK